MQQMNRRQDEEIIMSKKYRLMIDPTPAGYLYGFPKQLPEHAIAGTGHDLFILSSFDLTKWVVEQGYPEESFRYYRTWPEEVEYVYPGTDPQE